MDEFHDIIDVVDTKNGGHGRQFVFTAEFHAVLQRTHSQTASFLLGEQNARAFHLFWWEFRLQMNKTTQNEQNGKEAQRRFDGRNKAP